MSMHMVTFIDALAKPVYVHGIDFILAAQRNFRVSLVLVTPAFY